MRHCTAALTQVHPITLVLWPTHAAPPTCKHHNRQCHAADHGPGAASSAARQQPHAAAGPQRWRSRQEAGIERRSAGQQASLDG